MKRWKSTLYVWIAAVFAATALVPGWALAAEAASVCLPDTFQVGDNIVISNSPNSYWGSNDNSRAPAVSGDGRYVAFTSWANNLILPDTNGGAQDIYLYDRDTQRLERLNIGVGGTQGDNHSLLPFLSHDGRYVGFTSSATNLDQRFLGFYEASVYIHDRQSSMTKMVSLGTDGTPAGNSSGGAISGGGRYVAFNTASGKLPLGGMYAPSQLYVFDTLTNTSEPISKAANGSRGNGASSSGVLSADGRYVVFTSAASNLVPGDTNGKDDVFLFDRSTKVMERISVGNNGVQGYDRSIINYLEGMRAISDDGRFVVFESWASNFVDSDTNANRDVFVRDRQTQTTRLLSKNLSGGVANGFSCYPSISGNGRYATFSSTGNNIVTNPVRAYSYGYAAYVHDLQTGRIDLVSICNDGSICSSDDPPAISSDGGIIAFASTANNLLNPQVMVSRENVYIHRRKPVVCADVAPVITLVGADTVVVEAGGVYTDAGATAHDDVDGDITSHIAVTNPVNTLIPAVYTVKYNVTDSGNHAVEVTRSVSVEDTTPPVLAVPADLTVEATAPLSPVAIGQATATDVFPVSISNDAPTAYPVGTTIVNWTATDANKLTSSKPQNITIQDTIPPVVTPPPNITAEAAGPLTQVDIRTATATDAVGVLSFTNNAPVAYPLGITQIIWTASDAAGNTGSAPPQTINVVDNTPPILEGLSNQTLEATSQSGATASFRVRARDLVDPAPLVTCSATSGSTFPLGDTTVICTAKDATNNSSATGSFTITVRDTTPPVLTVPANITVPLNAPLGAPEVQAFLNGTTAIDIVDPTVTVTSTAPILFDGIGAKQVTFTAVDNFGNKTTATATIYVKYGCGGDFLPPVSLVKPFKVGSTIPVKFTLCDAYGSKVTSGVARLYLQQYLGDEPIGEPIEVTSTSSADIGNYFRVSEGVYIYNLYTKNLPPGTYQIRVLLDDGSINTIPLSLKQ